MRIRHLSIRNFRGIRELDWCLPDGNFYCLIGGEDSTKSTILEAIRRTFHPQWNLSFDDADFYQCKPKENAISIKMESFSSSLKTERTARKTYRTRDEAKADMFDYIERFYNVRRRHSTIGYLSPVGFEMQAGSA